MFGVGVGGILQETCVAYKGVSRQAWVKLLYVSMGGSIALPAPHLTPDRAPERGLKSSFRISILDNVEVL